jgi:signal transduction histidine kinase
LFSTVLLGIILSSNLYAIISLYALHNILLEIKNQSVSGLLLISQVQNRIGIILAEDKRYLLFSPIPPVAPSPVESELPIVLALLKTLPKPSGQAATLINASLSAETALRHSLSTEMNALAHGNRTLALSISRGATAPLLIHMAWLLRNLKEEYQHALERRIAETTGREEQMTTVSIEMTAIGSLLVLLLLFSFSRMVLTPIMALIEGTRRISQGAFHNPVNLPNTDEMGDLAKALNEMAHRLGELSRKKSEFVTVASHELRTPLTSIRGFIAMLKRQALGPLNEEQQKSLSVVGEEIDHLVDLVNQLLDLGRIEAGQMRLDVHRMELRPFLDRIIERYQLAAQGSGHRFIVDLDPDLPEFIRADGNKLAQILDNLLGNAFKFTQSGEEVHFNVRRDLTIIRFEVADTGIGIPPENLPFLFDKFYQVAPFDHRTKEGLGLGLAVTRGIVLAMGGSIEIAQNKPKGTIFLISIPVILEEGPID